MNEISTVTKNTVFLVSRLHLVFYILVSSNSTFPFLNTSVSPSPLNQLVTIPYSTDRPIHVSSDAGCCHEVVGQTEARRSIGTGSYNIMHLLFIDYTISLVTGSCGGISGI